MSIPFGAAQSRATVTVLRGLAWDGVMPPGADARVGRRGETGIIDAPRAGGIVSLHRRVGMKREPGSTPALSTHRPPPRCPPQGRGWNDEPPQARGLPNIWHTVRRFSFVVARLGRGKFDMEAPYRQQNHLLAILSDEEASVLEPWLEPVTLMRGEVLARPGQPIESAYFPLTGMVSVVALMSQGLGAEVATVGNEGMIGLPIFLGADSSPFHLMSQLTGHGLRIKADRLAAAIETQTRLATLLRTYSRHSSSRRPRTRRATGCIRSPSAARGGSSPPMIEPKATPSS